MFAKHYEIWSGGVAAAALLFGTFLLQTPLWLNGIVAAALFAGLFLIGSYQTEAQIEREASRMTLEHMREKIQQGKNNLKILRHLTAKMAQIEIRQQVLRICDLADRIFKNFEDSGDISRSSRFLLYLDRFLPLIEKYARVSATHTGREMLARDQEFLNVLIAVEQGFEEGFKNYLEKDVAEIRTVGTILKRMIKVAEIGK